MTDRNADKMPILLQAILWGKWFGSESNYKKNVFDAILRDQLILCVGKISIKLIYFP